MMEDSKAGKIPGSKSGKSTMSASGTNMKDFRLEYAKSGAAKCGVCEEKIKKVCGRFWSSASQLLAHQDYSSKHISNKYHQRPIKTFYQAYFWNALTFFKDVTYLGIL